MLERPAVEKAYLRWDFFCKYYSEEGQRLLSYLIQVKELAEELGVGFLTIGFDPKWEVKDVPIMPKNRYRSVLTLAKLLLDNIEINFRQSSYILEYDKKYV